jgi:hypothetical protein
VDDGGQTGETVRLPTLKLQDKWLQFLCEAFIIESVCFLALIFLIFLMNGCATMPDAGDLAAQTNPTETLIHSLPVEANGVLYADGTDVLPLARSYHFKVYPSAKINKIIWTTCHQSKFKNKPDTGWFNNNFEFDFEPAGGIEDQSSCALEIAITTEDAYSDLALFEFKDRREEVNLPATMRCNGGNWPTTGVSICQSAAGLRQLISFSEPVLLPENDKPGCNVMKTSDEKTYSYNIAPAECHYYFTAQSRSKNGKRRLFRLTTLGYTKVMR